MYGSIYGKFSSEVEKCIIWSSIQVLPNPPILLKILTIDLLFILESHAKLHKKPNKTLGADSI